MINNIPKKRFINIEHEKFCDDKDMKHIFDSEKIIVDYNIIIRLPILILDIYEYKKYKLIFNNRLLRQHISFNNYNYNFIAEKNITFDNIFKYENMTDLKWIRETNEYIKKLSYQQISLIYKYTVGQQYIKIINNMFEDLNQIKTISELKDAQIFVYDKTKNSGKIKYSTFIFPFIPIILEKYENDIENFINLPKKEIFSNKKIILINEKLFSVKEIIEILKNEKYLYLHFDQIMNLFNFNFYFKVIKELKKQFNNIFSNAPKTNKDMIFYRGTSSPYFQQDKKKNIYTVNKFTSISMELKTATQFLKKNGYLYRITIPKSTRLLFISGISEFPDQLEVLINPGKKFYVFNKKQKLAYGESSLEDENYFIPETDLCPKNTEIRDMVYLN